APRIPRRQRVEQLLGDRPCLFHERVVAREVADAQGGQARLPRAEDVAGAAQREVALGDREAVGRRGDGLEALARDVAERTLVEQDAVRRMRAAPDPSAQLVQLREAEPL